MDVIYKKIKSYSLDITEFYVAKSWYILQYKTGQLPGKNTIKQQFYKTLSKKGLLL
jgi:hypothetical protein